MTLSNIRLGTAVDGVLIDLRDMPREVQQIAFDKGMIPYIPADRERGDVIRS